MASPKDILKVTEVIDGAGFKAILVINLSGTTCPIGGECRYLSWPLPEPIVVGQYISGSLKELESIWEITAYEVKLPKDVLMVRSFAINMKNPGANGIRLEALIDAKFIVNGSELPDTVGGFQNNEVVVALAPQPEASKVLVTIRIPGVSNSDPAAYGYSILSFEDIYSYIDSRGWALDKADTFKLTMQRLNVISGQVWEGGITPAFPIYWPKP